MKTLAKLLLTLQEFRPELDKAGPLLDVIPDYPPLCHIL